MKNIKIGKRRHVRYTKQENIFEIENRTRKEAIEISKNFIHTKPIKYLLK